ncbi:MAG TPA: hypothetical protein VNB90_09475 [Cytophagaceae bacterium]|nr:hypothetical protein [Cytophagaceae bacterium]
MKKIIFLFALTLAGMQAEAQKVSEKTLNEICGCVKKIDKKLSEDAQTDQALACMATNMEKNFEALAKEYNLDMNNPEQAAEELGAQIGMQLVTQCPEIVPYMMNYSRRQQQSTGSDQVDINPDTLKLDSKVCALYKSGKYAYGNTYMNNKAIPETDSTAYTEIKDGISTDYSQDKKYYTKWSTRWISDCEWENTLIETNEPNVKMLLKKGDKVTMKAIGSTGKNLWVKAKMMGMDFIIFFKRIN